MMRNIFSLVLLFILSQLRAQVAAPQKRAAISHSPGANAVVQMPYNRLVQSAGKVVTFGSPELENHALDITVLPGNGYTAIEHRYGIVILNTATNSIVAQWSYADSAAYKSLMSTYSGITSFTYNRQTFIVWSASPGPNGKDSYVMMAEWNGKKIERTSALSFAAKSPAKTALPNAVAFTLENNVPFLYVVLNGNNELAKVNVKDKSVVWTAETGVAPFGVCINNNKAFVTNWAGPLVTDTTKEIAGTPWGSAYTNPVTGATKTGSVSIINTNDGSPAGEVTVGLHPNAIISSADHRFLYVANGNSDNVSVIDADKEVLVDSLPIGLFAEQPTLVGSTPNALCLDALGSTLYVANGLDNAIAVVKLDSTIATNGKGSTFVLGYIPTEAYPSGLALLNHNLYVTNLEANGANVLSPAKELLQLHGTATEAYTIHKQLASLSIIPLPSAQQLAVFTKQVQQQNYAFRLAVTNLPLRNGVAPKPLPERIGEPSVFKHVVYIIKENKTYDEVFGDVAAGRGDSSLCVYNQMVTPNQHALSQRFSLMDNYFASGKSSAEGHQWTDAAMVSDYVEKNVRGWFRSYPHRQEDALVYNKAGFIWNNALDHGKTVRIYGEACKTVYDNKLKWTDFFAMHQHNDSLPVYNTTTIARIRPIISAQFPDCDNFLFTDQLRADIFIKEWKNYEKKGGDSLPQLLIVSLPNDHTAGTSPDFPTPEAMVADNDLAVGRIIETITASRFWDSTVVFITEDDSQSGWDHISPYRTTGLIISPYSVLNKTVHTYYNQTSMVRTIEQILGLPPMNIIDATALPMFDFFTDTKSSFQYHLVQNNIPLNSINKPFASLQGKALHYAQLSKTSVFKDVDDGDDDTMNRILWFAAKGDKKYPAFTGK